MKIFFINGSYSDENIGLLKRATNNKLQIASHVFQQGIIKGLIDNNADFKAISAPFVPSYPFNNSLLTNPMGAYCYKGKEVGETIGFSNFIGYKERSVYHNLLNKIKTELKKWYFCEKNVLLIYSPYGPFLKTAAKLKSLYPNLIVGLIVTDRFCSTLSKLKETTWINKVRLFSETIDIERNISCVDKYILLAERLTDYATHAKGNHIIIEGIYDGSGMGVAEEKKDDFQKTLLYTGSLGIHTSVKELVDSFMMTQRSDFKLQICGNGYYADYIKRASFSDRRIEYLGGVNREEVLRLQRNATALINPRKPSIADTPYSFPSKTMEYLTSGTPMIGYQLEGIPREYYDYFYCINGESLEAMKCKIEEVLLSPQTDLNKKAKQAYEFVANRKSAKVQIEKLLAYLEF